MLMLSETTLIQLKQNAAAWAQQFDVGIVLDSNHCKHALGIQNYELIIAVGIKHEITNSNDSFESLRQFKNQHPAEWLFGYFSYDLKNQLEQLNSQHSDGIGFEQLYFFTPKHLLVIRTSGEIVLGEALVAEILKISHKGHNDTSVMLTQRIDEIQYKQDVEKIRKHIEEGDVYEMNYCTEFFADNISINPASVYNKLKQKSAVPFGVYLKHNHRYVMGASPERFLCKRGDLLYSQPIKGTAKRGADSATDEIEKQKLFNSEKERAENLMIVDLVRNDLARSAQTGSIKVDELFGIYSFPQVHQMISTVSASLHPQNDFIDAIQQAFPMGSMTGTPKIMAMQLIEKYEKTKRGLYSGAIGYIEPNTDFDLNVVIRSIQYNAETGYINFEVGSAITYDSVAQEEYAECLLKATAMKEVLTRV